MNASLATLKKKQQQNPTLIIETINIPQTTVHDPFKTRFMLKFTLKNGVNGLQQM